MIQTVEDLHMRMKTDLTYFFKSTAVIEVVECVVNNEKGSLNERVFGII